MERIGIIAIRSTSIRLLLAEISDIGYFNIIDDLKTPLKSCHDLISTGTICDNNISFIISTLKSYQGLCKASNVNKIFSISVGELNKCTNITYLLEKIHRHTGMTIELLDNTDEVRLTSLSVVRSIYVNNSLLVDIGETKTNITWLQNDELVKSVTLPIGSYNLSYKYNLTNRILKEDLEKNLEEISLLLLNEKWIFENEFESLIAVGNIARTAGKMDRLRHKYPLLLTHNYELLDFDLHELFNICKSKDLRQRQTIEGLSIENSETIVGGLSIFHTLISLLSPKKIFISGKSISEGIIYDYLLSKYKVNKDILNYSISGILHTLNLNQDHAYQVYKLCKALFDGLQPLHKLGNEYNKILKTAALLHDCGTSINYYNHHRHSFYVILQSYINGLTHKEILLSASIAASHRFNSYSVNISQFSSLLNKLDLKIINQIGILLKIAEVLDRTLTNSISDIDISIDSNAVTLRLSSESNIDFEINQAYRAKDTFKEIYKRELIILKAAD